MIPIGPYRPKQLTIYNKPKSHRKKWKTNLKLVFTHDIDIQLYAIYQLGAEKANSKTTEM